MSVLFEKKFPPSPTFESLNIRKTPIIESLIASLSGNLDEYDIQFTGRSIIARAKKSYQDRYRTAAATAASLEKRLSVVEAVLARSEAARAHTETVLKRSQMYTSLLSIIQDQLFKSLTVRMQQALKIAGLANLPQTFVIWWNAWNDRDHVSYPLPPSMAHYTLAPELAAFNHLLFNRRGDESKNGITVRKAWEKLDSVARDLMVHCWCRKNSNDIIRNAIAHPDMTKGGARELLTQDLCHDLQYLYPRAMTYISNAPEIFKADSASL